MAIATPTVAVITPAATFNAPLMSAEPLATALDNGNWLYLGHTPPLADFCPVTRVDANDRSYTVAIQPSLDGLQYEFRFVWLPQHAGTVSCRVRESDSVAGVYTDVVASTVTPAGAIGVWQRAVFTGVIPATARVLRFQMTGAGGSFYPSHCLARPLPDTAAVPFVAPFGQTASGFRVFDDALLRSAGAPINTEWLDRNLHNARAVVRDRHQCAFSFVQDDGVFRTVRFVAPPSASISTKTEMLVGSTTCSIPHTGETWIDVRALGVVSGGSGVSGVNRIRVESPNGGFVLLDASGALDTARLRVVGPRFVVRVTAIAPAEQTCSIHSVVGLWRPGDLS